MGREPLRRPRCGVAFARVVGALGPCEPCQLELHAEREQMRQVLKRPHPCEACGAEITGRRRYCSGTCRTTARRRRQTVGA